MQTQPAAILIVDDREENRDLLMRRLRPQGYYLATAENGRQALELLREHPFDLVLLDIMMPEMNGYQVLEQMKADPVLCHLPVIVISAVNEIESVAQCIELGAEDYLSKPFNRVLLHARIGNALEKKRLHDQEQAYREELEAAHQTKNRAILAIAHELRNFLTPIGGYLDLLRSGLAGAISEEQAQLVQIVWANAQRVKSLLVDLNDVPRIATGQLQLQPEAVSVADIVSEVVDALEARVNSKQQTLLVNVPQDLPAVWADRTRLIQVLMNLVSNAHKYTPPKGEIRVSAERVEDAPPVVRLTIEDNGLGIAPEDQGNIFAEFFRSADEQVRREPGVGLGLSITRRLVELQGGRISFESVFRQGTKFHFTVPVVEG
jgi:signal transduction histidine kinase